MITSRKVRYIMQWSMQNLTSSRKLLFYNCKYLELMDE